MAARHRSYDSIRPLAADCTCFSQAKPPGIRQIEAISLSLTTAHRWLLFASIFLISFAYGLDCITRANLQGYATSEYGKHSLIAGVNVVRSVASAAAQPAFAKTSDVFGRRSILLLSVFLYTLGTALQAGSRNIEQFAGGALLYQLGFTGLVLMIEILVADTTSLRNRLLFSHIPCLPFLFNAYFSGYIVESAASHNSWRSGIGVWALILPLASLPLFFVLGDAARRAKAEGLLVEDRPPPGETRVSLALELFNKIDAIGLLLLGGTLILLLLPLTLTRAATTPSGASAHTITLLVGCFLALPAFLLWECKGARYPIVPFSLLKKRTVIAGLVAVGFLNASAALQGDYLYAILLVAYDQDEANATRITNLFAFTSVLFGLGLGFLVRRVRRTKKFILLGSLIYVSAFAVLHHTSAGSSGASGVRGLVLGQVLLGLAGALVPYPTQAVVQAATQHQHTAVVTSLLLAVYNVGGSVGYALSGLTWTRKMPALLLAGGASEEIAREAYENPYSFARKHTWGTAERTSVVQAYRACQRELMLVGLCISAVVVVAAFCLRDYRMGSEPSRPESADSDTDTLDSERQSLLST